MKISTINLSNINKAVTGVTETVRKSKLLIDDISEKIGKTNERIKTKISDSAKVFQRRQQAIRRKVREDLIEASGLGGALRRTNKIISTSTRGFLGRILDFVGTILVGWAIVNIPKTLNEAINLSKKNNPDILIAKLDLDKSEKELAISQSDLKPTASLSLQRSYTDDLSATIDEKEQDVLKATLSWPFYSGGKKRSTINKNSNLTTRKRLLLDDAVRTNETNVASAWSSLQSSESFLSSVKIQVKSSQIAYEGIAAEYERGSRNTLDVIQSNALLLSAQISLANSEKNYLMAQYNLLKAVGLLNSQYLNLK